MPKIIDDHGNIDFDAIHREIAESPDPVRARAEWDLAMAQMGEPDGLPEPVPPIKPVQ